MINHNKKKLSFFLSEAATHFQGGARPFINWAMELPKEHYEIDFLLHKCGQEIEEFIKTNNDHVNLKRVENFNETLQHSNSSEPHDYD